MLRLIYFFVPWGVPLSLVWLGLIFFLSEQTGTPRPPLFPGDDKLIHFWLYAPLGLGLLVGLENNKMFWPSPTPLGRPFRIYLPNLVRTMTIIILAAIFDEAHQGLVPGRSPDIWDVVADIIGGAAGMAAGYFLLQKPIKDQ